MTHRGRRRAARRHTAWTALAVAAGATVAAGAAAVAVEDPALDQEIDREQAVSAEPTVIADGHVDVGTRYADGEWTVLVHDDSADPPVWRTADSVALHVTDAAVLAVPDDDRYAFVPAQPGEEVHVLPQVQQPGVVWLGWNTQDPEVMERVDRGATFRLLDVHGPGELVMFLQAGDLGDPDVVWDSREPYPQDMWVPVNTHAHANWVFSEPGVYFVDVEVSADLVTGDWVSDVQAFRFAVGAGTDPGDALSAEHEPSEPGGVTSGPGEAAGEDAAGAGPGGDDTGAAAGDSDDEVPIGLLAAGAGAIALIAAVVLVAVRGRRAKRAAGSQPGDSPEVRS